jgi:hypothetical protein
MKRPLLVTLIGYLFIASGTIGIIYHAPGLKEINTRPEVILVLFVRMLAILGGVFTLRGANWARWLLVIWIAYHVILSYFHSPVELITHLIVFAFITIGLFHAKVTWYFEKKESDV